MAITETSIPTDNPSVQDNVWVAALSDNVDEVNFKYVFDVYNNDTNEQLIRAKIFPNQVDDYGYFDMGSILRNLIQYDWLYPNESVIQTPPQLTDNQIGVNYRVEIGEDYNIGASGITQINMAAVSGKVYNWTPTLFDRRRLNLTTYYNKFLTNRPLNKPITLYRDEPLFLGFLRDFSAGVNLTYYINNYSTSANATSSSQSRFHQFNIGPSAAETEFGIVPPNVTKYFFQLINNTGPKVEIIIDDCTPMHKPYYLVFMNRFGVFDSARFGCVSKFNMDVTRKSFEQMDAIFNEGNVNYYETDSVFRKWNETKINYAQNINWNVKLMMDYPTDEEYVWLAELVYSPLVYMKVDDDYYPVTIKNTNYEQSKRIYNKLKTLEIEVEMNTKLNGFRR